MIPADKIVKGLKFLDPALCTTRDGIVTSYIPAINQWMKHPDPAEWDGKDCGPGRWHIMAKCSAAYAPRNWYPWHASGRGVVGFSNEKFGAVEIMIKQIPQKTWWRYLRRFGAGADLTGAYLTGADLRDAYLTGAYLTGAYLTGAYLTDAYLTGAYLTGAYLTDADLTGADLRDADLRDADLTGADLRDADLRDADLTGATACNHTVWGPFDAKAAGVVVVDD